MSCQTARLLQHPPWVISPMGDQPTPRNFSPGSTTPAYRFRSQTAEATRASEWPNEILNKLQARRQPLPGAQMDGYLAQAKKIVPAPRLAPPEENYPPMACPHGRVGGDGAETAPRVLSAFPSAIVQSMEPASTARGRWRPPSSSSCAGHPEDRGRELEVRRAVHPFHPHDHLRTASSLTAWPIPRPGGEWGKTSATQGWAAPSE